MKLVAVSIDDSRSVSKVRPYVNASGWDYDIYIDANKNLARAMGVSTVPHTFLLNSKKEIVWQHRGYVDGDFWKQYTIDGGGAIPQLETETFSAEQLRAYRTKAYMKFYLRPDLIRRKLSKSEGRAELLEMAGGAQVLGEIIKSTIRRAVPKVGIGKWATV